MRFAITTFVTALLFLPFSAHAYLDPCESLGVGCVSSSSSLFSSASSVSSESSFAVSTSSAFSLNPNPNPNPDTLHPGAPLDTVSHPSKDLSNTGFGDMAVLALVALAAFATMSLWFPSKK